MMFLINVIGFKGKVQALWLTDSKWKKTIQYLMLRSQGFEPIPQNLTDWQIENQNLLSSFPLILSEQHLQIYEQKYNENQSGIFVKNIETLLKTKVQAKVSAIVKFFLNKSKSKKQGFDILKNLQTIQDCKGDERKRDSLKTIMKLKMTKKEVQKQEVLKICHSLIMELTFGNM